MHLTLYLVRARAETVYKETVIVIVTQASSVEAFSAQMQTNNSVQRKCSAGSKRVELYNLLFNFNPTRRPSSEIANHRRCLHGGRSAINQLKPKYIFGELRFCKPRISFLNISWCFICNTAMFLIRLGLGTKPAWLWLG